MELLSPAGNVEKLKYAYFYGADASYIGLKNFSLRVKADNFYQDEYKKVIELKEKFPGKKLHCALNISFHNHEIDRLIENIPYFKQYPIDAFIIQDLGIVPIIQKNFPDAQLHLSTQASCMNREAVKMYKSLGFSRVVMGREASLKEIAEIKDAVPDMEIECFIHGAMCIAYAGRCLMSSYLTGRRAQEGFCSHTCRWDYDVLTAKKIAEKHEKEGYDFSDMAVLFRSYSQQAVFERAFLRHGIPYNTETVKGFFSDGPVSDIAAYLKLCAYSDDRMAYAKVLSSPFVNLSVTETQAVLSLKQDAFSEGAQEVLEEDSLIRFKNAAVLFEEFKDFAKENSLTKTVFKLWYDFGYRFETMWNETVRMYEKLYDLLFALAREGDEKNLNLAGFVDGLCEYEEENSKLEINIPVEKSEGVHIMTVHKSKGLEFKIVFVCDTQRGSVKEKSVVPVYYSSRYGFVLNTPLHFDAKNYFYLLAKRENELKQCAEMRRLTYVALTRAEDEIFITNSNYDIPKDVEEYSPGGIKNADSIFKTLAPVIAFYGSENQSGNFSYEEVSPFSKIERIEPYFPGESFNNTRRKNTKQAREEFVRVLKKDNFYEQSEILRKETVEKKYIFPSKLYEEAEKQEQSKKYSQTELKNLPFFEINEIVQKHPGFDFSNFGTIAHSYLEKAVKFGGQKVKAPYNNQEVAGLENSTGDIKKVEEICDLMAESFMNCELGKQVQSAVWKKEEFEFKSLFGKKILSGIIDLVFESEDGTFSVVDYKTNQEIHPEIYYAQLACYRQAVAQMFSVPEEKVRCYLHYLRFGKSVEILPENLKILDR